MRILFVDSVGASVGKPAQFSEPTISYLIERGHTVLVSDGFAPRMASEVDVVVAEWCNQDAFDAAASGVCNRLVIRCRGYDVWGPLEHLQWRNVHALIFESAILARTAPPDLPVRSSILATGVNLSELKFQENRHGPVVALVARAVADKGYQLAYEWARQHPEVQLHITTANAAANGRFMQYLWHNPPQNVHIHGGVETIKWLRSIGANYLLSTSVFESLGYSIAEAMALGIKPLIHDAPGLSMWPVDLRWTSLAQLDRLMAAPYDSCKLRRFVEQHLDAETLSAKFESILLKDLPTAAPEPRAALAAAVRAELAAGQLEDAERTLMLLRQLGGPRGLPSDLAVALAGASGQPAPSTWALRAMSHGPRVDAMRVLAEAAEEQGDLDSALAWYQAAAALPASAATPTYTVPFDLTLDARIEEIRGRLAERPGGARNSGALTGTSGPA